jgi:hypothetical protein
MFPSETSLEPRRNPPINHLSSGRATAIRSHNFFSAERQIESNRDGSPLDKRTTDINRRRADSRPNPRRRGGQDRFRGETRRGGWRRAEAQGELTGRHGCEPEVRHGGVETEFTCTNKEQTEQSARDTSLLRTRLDRAVC